MPAKKATKPAPKKKLSEWQKFVSKHIKTPAIQKLPFGDRLKKISELYKKQKK